MKFLHNISFGIPEEKITKEFFEKKKILSTLIPGDTRTYIYENETDYYNQYNESYFAITRKKGGWDCMRHYEILANNCIPYFIDIEKCPSSILTFLPKELLFQANNLYEQSFENKKIEDLSEKAIKDYKILLEKLFVYTKKYLTTEKLSNYILEKTNFTNVKKILFLSGDRSPDYLRCLMLHGFKQLLGAECHDYPKIEHIYKIENNKNYLNLYGKGFTYTNLLEQYLHDSSKDVNIEKDIKEKRYEIVIYGSYHRGMPFYELVNSVYKNEEIILLCGEDTHNCDFEKYLKKKHQVFVRELEIKMKIFYGFQKNRKDVTELCFEKLKFQNFLQIPSGDFNRASVFTDPIPGVLKKIYVLIDEKESVFSENESIKINVNDFSIESINVLHIPQKLQNIHNSLKIKHGSFNEELPEQKMVVQYLQGHEKVLEIGSNIGRNSLVISSIVDNKNFVTLESDQNIAKALEENKNLNGKLFFIENSALSKRKLIQSGWNTKPSEQLENGYSWVQTINWEELQSKYKIDFDTLVLDCEGAFYFILMDMPDILNNINLIIMENDYHNIEHKKFVDSVLLKNNFENVYKESGGWGPCHNNFFEVWKKNF